MNKNLLKIFTAAVVLSATASTQAFADSWATKACSDENGIGCWQCGTTCTATLYSDGKLVVSGTGSIDIYKNGGGNQTFSGLEVQPTSLVIEEGITGTGMDAFWRVSTISSVELPNSFRSVSYDGLNFGGSGVTKFIIGENSYLPSHMPVASKVTVVCKGDVEVCRSSKSSFFTSKGVAATFTDELRDENGKLLEKWSADGYEVYDENENIVAKYSKTGALLSQYSYNNDGSLYVYDANGKLIGAKKTSAFTPAEAAALVRKGNNNTVKLIFK